MEELKYELSWLAEKQSLGKQVEAVSDAVRECSVRLACFLQVFTPVFTRTEKGAVRFPVR